jgi:Asp-tRNA(Asn)/Glu-tRNA(Gln) amidotransferase A subunit family amidase
MYDGGVAGLPKAHLGRLAGDVGDLSGITLGVFPEWLEDASPAVVGAAKNAIALLEARGATVKEIAIPNIGWLRLAHAIKISTEFGVVWDAAFSASPLKLEPNTAVQLGIAHVMTGTEVLSADIIRRYAFDYVNAIFDEKGIDAIVTPTTSITAPVIDSSVLRSGISDIPTIVELLKYVFLGNLLGLPGVSVPVGFDESNDDMPMGLMFNGAQYSEDLLLFLSRATEDALQHPRTPPPSAVRLASLRLPWEVGQGDQ